MTLQPALPKARAIAFPMPRDAPVTTATGASTAFTVSTEFSCVVATMDRTTAKRPSLCYVCMHEYMFCW